MRAEQLIVEPFEFRTITEFESEIKLNEHGYAKISGYVTDKQKNKALELMTNEVWGMVGFLDESGKPGMLFCGLAVNLQLQEENDSYLMTVELKTGTYLMDLKEHIRVFQSPGITYSAMQKTFLSTYVMGECLMLKSDCAVGEMLVQYKETDWEFAKRLAARTNTVLIPNEKNAGVKYSFGVAEGNAKKIDTYREVEIIKNIGSYQKKRQNGVVGIEENDELAYGLNSREIVFLGDCIAVKGKNYLVAEVQRTWVKKEVWNHYVLKTLKGTQQVPYRNKKIIGATMQGKVTGVKADMVQITVNCDENGNRGGQKWFPYSTVFSSPDGTGWYCMPEIEDRVQLHFPSEIERMAYVSSSVNMESADPSARSVPDNKSIKNRQGKEILFTPEKLVITNNRGMSITIDDNVGIVLNSDKDIIMKAKEGIGLVSEEQAVQMVAGTQILLQQNETRLELKEDIVMSGGQVNMQ